MSVHSSSRRDCGCRLPSLENVLPRLLLLFSLLMIAGGSVTDVAAPSVSWTSAHICWSGGYENATYSVSGQIQNDATLAWISTSNYTTGPIVDLAGVFTYTNLSDLLPCRNYKFVVKAFDVNGGLLGSAPVLDVFTFDGNDENVRVTNVTVVPLNVTAVHVSWTPPPLVLRPPPAPPIQQCISGYRVTVSTVPGAVVSSVVVDGEGATKARVSGLQPCLSYQVEVAAELQAARTATRTAAWGPPQRGDANVTLPGGDPSMPRGLHVNSSILPDTRARICASWRHPEKMPSCVETYEVTLTHILPCSCTGVEEKASTPYTTTELTSSSKATSEEDEYEYKDEGDDGQSDQCFLNCKPCSEAESWRSHTSQQSTLPLTKLFNFCPVTRTLSSRASPQHASSIIVPPATGTTCIKCDSARRVSGETNRICIDEDMWTPTWTLAGFIISVMPRTWRGKCTRPVQAYGLLALPKPGAGKMVSVRSRQALLSWPTLATASACPCQRPQVGLAVLCVRVNKAHEPVVAISTPLDKDSDRTAVLVDGLDPGSQYTCYAKYANQNVTSDCSEPIMFRTTTRQEGRAMPELVNVTFNGTFLSWTDEVNDFDTEYLVTARAPGSRVLPPSDPHDPRCPPRCEEYRFLVRGSCCCGGLTHFLPALKEFELSVETGGNASSRWHSNLSIRTPAKAPRAVGFVIKDNPEKCNGEPAASLTLQQKYPTCQDESIQNYVIYMKYTSPNGSQTPLQSVQLPHYKPIREFTCSDGCFKMPLNEVFTDVDWCDARNATMRVDIKVTNEVDQVTSHDNYVVPSIDLNPDADKVSARVVDAEAGLVNVSFSSSLFLATKKQPDFYQIIVTEGRSGVVEGNCVSAAPTLPASTATDSNLPFRATCAGWNPFRDGCNATAFLIGGSENRCNDTDDSDGSSSVARVSHCNRPLRAGKVYTIQVQAVIAVPRIIVTSLAVVEVPGDDQDLKTVLHYIAFLALPLGAINLVLLVRFTKRCCSRYRHGGCCWRKPVACRPVTHATHVVHRPSAYTLRPKRCPSDTPKPLGCMSNADRAWAGVPEPVTERQFRELCENMPAPFMCPQLARQFEAMCALSSQVAASTPSRVGRLPMNGFKNRYSNVIPFDANRVRLLDAPDDDASNYINASHIMGFSGKHEYIAAQGPKDNTVRDFWGMVHDYNVRTVVMLTKLVEDGKNKCHQYYPELGDRYTWGDLSVACCVQNDLLAYTLRTIVMTKGPEERLVNHLHFREWPDFGCPASPKHVLQFCITLRRQAVLFPGKIVVHCSAGVGRTGTLIGLDILLQCMKAKKKIDIFGVVLKLREQRPFMVQTQEQYCFLFKCLKVALDDPIIRKYKPNKGPKKAVELQTLALQVFQKSFQCKK